MVRALASHQCGLGSILARCHVWVDLPCSEGVSAGFQVFLAPHQERGPAWKPSKTDARWFSSKHEAIEILSSYKADC